MLYLTRANRWRTFRRKSGDNDQSFNDMLTNEIAQQLGPV